MDSSQGTAGGEEFYGMSYQYSCNFKHLLGTGAFGAVYKALITHQGDNAEIQGDAAVKLSHFTKETDPLRDLENWEKRRARWQKLVKLRHDRLLTYHKISVYQSARGASVEYLMDFCSGGDLASLLGSYRSKKGHLDQLEALCYAMQIIDGVDYLHVEKIIHGDLKPGNILVKPNEDHHKLLIGDLDDLIPMQQSISNPGDFHSVHGTFCYTSPECLRKLASLDFENLGQKSDIWSIGCIIHDLANCCLGIENKIFVKEGNPPLSSEHLNDHALAMKIIDGYIPFINDNITTPFKDMIKSCLQVDSRDRPSAEELLRLCCRKINGHEATVRCSVCPMSWTSFGQSEPEFGIALFSGTTYEKVFVQHRQKKKALLENRWNNLWLWNVKKCWMTLFTP
ncbi:mitogen-activated protein kinase kinase kinase 19-like [Paramacrobiotus metropolitanus]|uniref:mitogen-activated protein kinase kinase kinase 19-like n=1 Tax=Paramacrobiotus metropolitanus TaxID=2943436 RepID=UPI0024457D84|nr:mitogen-activated protein kinase kinase kinase 19-like [Paramacrobiotus metropolitanus]XP_055353855.1 mitogen-activated protein kinase kinase kinase 19-like [Paramacrobiotus metropolitanus]XP_055353856.1 mitogen-activated protein kinase kinase kinase 19-like [Paramacrobiotus metropolitanus]